MPTVADTGEATRRAETATQLAAPASPNSFLAHVSAPSISANREPLYTKLVSEPGIIPELKLERLEGEVRALSFGAALDLQEHFEILRRDFIGLPLLCYAHAQLIVCIRRKLDLPNHLPVFLRLWAMDHEFLAEQLNTRWLISACDTFADYGSDAQKAAAMLLVVLVNTVKLAETERLSFGDPTTSASKLDAVMECRRAKTHIELWDGVTAFAVFTGDMPRNMLRRLATITDRDPALATIARTLIRRAVAADTVLGRLARMNPGFLPAEFA